MLSLWKKSIKNNNFQYVSNNHYRKYAKSHHYCSGSGIAIVYQLLLRLLQIPMCNSGIAALWCLFNNTELFVIGKYSNPTLARDIAYLELIKGNSQLTSRFSGLEFHLKPNSHV